MYQPGDSLTKKKFKKEITFKNAHFKNTSGFPEDYSFECKNTGMYIENTVFTQTKIEAYDELPFDNNVIFTLKFIGEENCLEDCEIKTWARENFLYNLKIKEGKYEFAGIKTNISKCFSESTDPSKLTRFTFQSDKSLIENFTSHEGNILYENNEGNYSGSRSEIMLGEDDEELEAVETYKEKRDVQTLDFRNCRFIKNEIELNSGQKATFDSCKLVASKFTTKPDVERVQLRNCELSETEYTGTSLEADGNLELIKGGPKHEHGTEIKVEETKSVQITGTKVKDESNIKVEKSEDVKIVDSKVYNNKDATKDIIEVKETKSVRLDKVELKDNAPDPSIATIKTEKVTKAVVDAKFIRNQKAIESTKDNKVQMITSGFKDNKMETLIDKAKTVSINDGKFIGSEMGNQMEKVDGFNLAQTALKNAKDKGTPTFDISKVKDFRINAVDSIKSGKAFDLSKIEKPLIDQCKMMEEGTALSISDSELPLVKMMDVISKSGKDIVQVTGSMTPVLQGLKQDTFKLFTDENGKSKLLNISTNASLDIDLDNVDLNSMMDNIKSIDAKCSAFNPQELINNVQIPDMSKLMPDIGKFADKAISSCGNSDLRMDCSQSLPGMRKIKVPSELMLNNLNTERLSVLQNIEGDNFTSKIQVPDFKKLKEDISSIASMTQDEAKKIADEVTGSLKEIDMGKLVNEMNFQGIVDSMSSLEKKYEEVKFKTLEEVRKLIPPKEELEKIIFDLEEKKDAIINKGINVDSIPSILDAVSEMELKVEEFLPSESQKSVFQQMFSELKKEGLGQLKNVQGTINGLKEQALCAVKDSLPEINNVLDGLKNIELPEGITLPKGVNDVISKLKEGVNELDLSNLENLNIKDFDIDDIDMNSITKKLNFSNIETLPSEIQEQINAGIKQVTDLTTAKAKEISKKQMELKVDLQRFVDNGSPIPDAIAKMDNNYHPTTKAIMRQKLIEPLKGKIKVC